MCNSTSSTIPCANTVLSNSYNVTFQILKTWTYDLTVGYNKINLSSPIAVSKGNMLMLTQFTARIAIDQTNIASYSDLQLKSSLWIQLNSNFNWRFYFDTLTDSVLYLTTFNLNHVYPNSGIYIMKIKIKNFTTQQIVNISECKLANLFIS